MIPKPCPFCGSHNVGTQEGESYRYAMVACHECGALGPPIRVRDIRPAADPRFSERDETAAITEWNRRNGESGDAS